MSNEKNTINFTFNFNAPVGQNIAHVDKLEAHFDKDMTMQVVDTKSMADEDSFKRREALIKEKVKNEQVPNISENRIFHTIIQHEEPEKLIKRLHQLIDGRKGADVGCVLLKCFQDGHLTRKPTQKEFESEFTLIGGWKAIHNYMSDNNENALDRANKIIIF